MLQDNLVTACNDPDLQQDSMLVTLQLTQELHEPGVCHKALKHLVKGALQGQWNAGGWHLFLLRRHVVDSLQHVQHTVVAQTHGHQTAWDLNELTSS